MIKLTIGNSLSQIQGLEPKDEKALRKLLSYHPNPAQSHYTRFGPKPTPLVDKKGVFPTGLLNRVHEFLGTTVHSVHDNRGVPEPHYGLFDWVNIPIPYPEQQNAVEASLAHHRGIVSAVTGLGKSLIAVLLVQRLQVPTLIVVPTLGLKHQLTETFKYYLGGESVSPLGLGPITIENVDSLPSDKNKYQIYQCLIIDEFHRSAAKTYRKLNQKVWGGIYYRFGLTATPTRSQDNEQILLESILSDIIYEITYEDASAKGYIVPVQAFYVDLPKQETEAKTWASVYSDLVVNNKIRNDIIVKLLNNLEGKSTLCLVKEIAHGETLNRESGVSFASGAEDNTQELVQKFNKGDTALIGTTGVLGTGVDTKPAEYIILAAGGKSPIQFQQNIGRGLRRYPGKEVCTIIMFRDESHKFLLRHFKDQVKILKNVYGIVPERLEV